LLDTLPKILIIHLKRFKVSNYSQKKLNYFINIPSEIRLDFLLKEKEKYKENTLYNLFAIVVHVGTGNEYGHYYCVIKIAGRWVKFDDENVLVMDKADISSLFGNPDEEYEFTVNNCAYLLFYEMSENNI
jgi:ubiquitin C-terminal hydrolase